ncbi:MAG: hypothetical protein IJW86_10685 [Clostridia bacterium]|nr:hypothetical protein [Clostridia bacterium]MBQ7296636.1 hypothetical protein [Clostridia bacterium]
MKKVISILLAVAMVFAMGTMAFAVVVEEPVVTDKCTCDDHKAAPLGSCHCCVLCPNIDKSYLTSCAKDGNADGTYDGSLCCAYCTGIFPCGCGCDCCDPNNENTGSGSIFGPVDEDAVEDAQDDFISGFQKILKRISDVFDNFFNSIFEFLRLDEVLGSIQ